MVGRVLHSGPGQCPEEPPAINTPAMRMSTSWIVALVALLPLTAPRSVLDPRDEAAAEAVAEANAEVNAEVANQYPALVPYFESTLRPCPALAPTQIDVDQLLGPWHLSLLLLADRSPLDGALDLDESLCAGVDVVRTNGSMLRMDWHLHQLGLPRGIADLQLQVPVAIASQQPGLWALATPLGGEMLGTVTHAVPRSYFVLSVCGDPGAGRGAGRTGGGAVHVLTALLSRDPPSALGSLELLRLSGLMFPTRGAAQLRHGGQRLLSWGQC